MSKRDIIDPHHHLWTLKGDMYPWLRKPMHVGVGGNIESIASDYVLDDYRADTGSYHLLASVHIEADYDRPFAVDETAWLARLRQDQGGPDAVVAYAALESADLDRTLDGHMAHGDFVKGIRQILCHHDNPDFRFVQRGDLMRDPQWRTGFAALSRRGLSFDMMIYPHQLADAADLASDFPDCQIILNHGAMPFDRSAEGLAHWRSGLRDLARRENVVMKVSGLGQTDWSWTVDSMRPMIRDLIEIFGPDRAMFASNFPVDKAYSSFDALYQTFETVVADLSDDEQEALFWRTADHVYRLGVART
ncbi:amidohydrolase family protein [Shimia biformata]|uniref:amidohydrolase family protein n=1 Tax=Shimia biformata TaxID=1294299 RepID=UPI001951306D|nr:amidohydrolase family protein [Shimia biformata]